MGLEISRRYFSYTFDPISAKHYDDIAYYGGIQAITFRGNWPRFKSFWHFDILTWHSIGKF